ncbi:MAG TPA: hypothetical protein PK771_12695 [Spirochaetota bacterium]|nr:hypothetical protein [Spirochaetota bacterium]
MGSDFLFVNPSFVNGIARTIDLFGNFSEYNISKNSLDADKKALYEDFKQVGKEQHRRIYIRAP